MPEEITGEKSDVKRLHEAVDFMLYLQVRKLDLDSCYFRCIIKILIEFIGLRLIMNFFLLLSFV